VETEITVSDNRTTARPHNRDTLSLPSLLDRCVEAALSGLSAQSRRVYASHITRFFDWQGEPHNPRLDRESVKAYMRALELCGSTAQVRNQALAALKRLAVEAAELGWIEHSSAAQIRSIKSKRVAGIRTGCWLDTAQVTTLLGSPDRTTLLGKRDAAVLALLIGCGLRRSETCGLTTSQLVSVARDRTILQNVVGKGGRVRSVAVPKWAAQLLGDWMKEIPE